MKNISLILVLSTVIFLSCTKITEDDISREVAINVGNCVQSASQLVPTDYVGQYSNTVSWNGGTVKIEGDLSGSSVGNYTIQFTNVTYEYQHKDGKKEWKTKITHNGTLSVSQSGNIINAETNMYSTSGTVTLKKKDKQHSGSGAVKINLSGAGANNADVYGIRVTW